MTTLLQDLRYAVRLLTRSPGFALVAIATLALGIGANTAIFSVVNALLLRPLPYAQADRLVMVWQDMRARGGPAQEWATPGNFADWQKAPSLFEAMAALQGWQPSLTGSGAPESLTGEQVTAGYFDVLGISPALGRGFRADEDIPNAPRVVILSHRFWLRRFGADPRIIGRALNLGGEPHEVVGIMPAYFRPVIATAADVWRPRRLNLSSPARGAVVLRVVARLAPGVSMSQAAVSADLLSAQLETANPEWNTKTRINLVPLHRQVVGDIRQGLLVLLAAVSFVLLIACANIANLLLVRASGRAREIAVRLALGAGRRRLIRQLLTESLLLAAVGGVAGVLLAFWGVEALLAIAPQGAPRLSEIAEIGLDGTALTFAAALILLTGLVFGIVPALHASKPNLAPALKEGGRGSSGAVGNRTRRALVVFEVAIALVLLVGSGLLLRTLDSLQRFDLGFTPDRVLVATVLPPRVSYSTAEQQVAFLRSVARTHLGRA